jgi:hypothetical protein
MLVRHAMTLELSAEAMKAWSQNLGHADVLTTFTSYGQVPVHRQGELIRAMAASDAPGDPSCTPVSLTMTAAQVDALRSLASRF